MTKLKNYIILLVPLLTVLLTGCSINQQTNINTNSLDNYNYVSNNTPVKTVNHNKSKLNPKSWNKEHINYGVLDNLNRASKPSTAYLSYKNIAKSSYRTSQTVKPSGWHQKFNSQRQPIINRGHKIAYSLSGGIGSDGTYHKNNQVGDQNNITNLFTQTAFSNQKLQTVYESKVRNALYNHKKVIYQVQPIFKNQDLMAKGVHLQAISTDKKLNFNVYIYNVQPGFNFDYSTGRSQINRDMKVPQLKNSPNF